MVAKAMNTSVKIIKMSLILLFPVCQILKVFPAKVNEDDEGAMDTICKANEGAGKIACPYSELFWSVFSNSRTEYGPE